MTPIQLINLGRTYEAAQEILRIERKLAEARRLIADLREWACELAGEWEWKRGGTPSNVKEMAMLDADIERAKKMEPKP